MEVEIDDIFHVTEPASYILGTLGTFLGKYLRDIPILLFWTSLYVSCLIGLKYLSRVINYMYFCKRYY